MRGHFTCPHLRNKVQRCDYGGGCNRLKKSFSNLLSTSMIMAIIALIVLFNCSIIAAYSPSDNLGQWMIDSYTTLKLKVSNGSSADTAAVSCGAIRDYYLSKGESVSSISGNLFYLFLLDGSNNKVTYQTKCLFDVSSKGMLIFLVHI